MNKFLQYRINKRRYDGGSPIGLPPELLMQLAGEQQPAGNQMASAIPDGQGAIDPALLQQLMSQQQPSLSASSIPEEQATGIDAIRNIEEGGLHEENPLEGVPIGKDEDGIQNLVEEDEVIYKDFVFSNRIPIDKRLIEPFNLSPSFAGKTYAQIAKKLQDEASERPNDPISQRGLNAMMSNLRVAQEAQKRREEMEERFKELRQSSDADESTNAEVSALSDQIDDFDSNPRGFIEAMEQQNQAIEQEVEQAKQAQAQMAQDGMPQQQMPEEQMRTMQEQGNAPQEIDPAILYQLMAQQGAPSGVQGGAQIDPSMLGLAYGGRIKDVYKHFAKGGGIHIKEENRGKFTESAKRAGMGVQEYARKILANKEKYSNAIVRRANFARNARKWDGGSPNLHWYQNQIVIPEDEDMIYAGKTSPYLPFGNSNIYYSPEWMTRYYWPSYKARNENPAGYTWRDAASDLPTNFLRLAMPRYLQQAKQQIESGSAPADGLQSYRVDMPDGDESFLSKNNIAYAMKYLIGTPNFFVDNDRDIAFLIEPTDFDMGQNYSLFKDADSKAFRLNITRDQKERKSDNNATILFETLLDRALDRTKKYTLSGIDVACDMVDLAQSLGILGYEYHNNEVFKSIIDAMNNKNADILAKELFANKEKAEKEAQKRKERIKVANSYIDAIKTNKNHRQNTDQVSLEDVNDWNKFLGYFSPFLNRDVLKKEFDYDFDRRNLGNKYFSFDENTGKYSTDIARPDHVLSEIATSLGYLRDPKYGSKFSDLIGNVDDGVHFSVIAYDINNGKPISVNKNDLSRLAQYINTNPEKFEKNDAMIEFGKQYENGNISEFTSAVPEELDYKNFYANWPKVKYAGGGFMQFLSNNAPTFIKSAQTLQSLQNLRDARKSPNYYTAEMLRDAANKQMGYSLAGFSPVTTRMKARTVDPMMMANRLSSEARGNRAAIANAFRGNRGAIANALLANAYNAQRGISDAYNQAVLTNNQALAQAAQINQATEQANAQLGAQVSSQNAQIRQNALSKYAATMNEAAKQYHSLDKERQDRIDATQKAWNDTLGSLYTDLYNYNNTKSDPALDYYTNLNGVKKYKGE